MEIELRNFYPIDRDEIKSILKGNLHVAIKCGDIELNLRGVFISRKGEKWIAILPFRRGVDHKNGNPLTYPVLSFSDPKLNKILINAILEKAPEFIEKFYQNINLLVETKNSDPDIKNKIPIMDQIQTNTKQRARNNSNFSIQKNTIKA